MVYTMENYFAEFVWAYPKWGEDGWDDAQMRIGAALEAAKDGEQVQLEELDDWEKLREANKAADIKGMFAPKLRRFQKAIKSAHAPRS